MGASDWSYWADYTDDLDEMFEDLRQEVFLMGDYEPPWDADDDYSPASIDKLVDACDEEGTHSILDIEEISSEPLPHDAEWEDEFLKLVPLREGQLRRIFDTTKPTREEIKEKEPELQDLDPTGWSGRWIIAYHAGQPSEYYIFGSSGE